MSGMKLMWFPHPLKNVIRMKIFEEISGNKGKNIEKRELFIITQRGS